MIFTVKAFKLNHLDVETWLENIDLKASTVRFYLEAQSTFDFRMSQIRIE